MWLSLWYLVRIPIAIIAATAVLLFIFRYRPMPLRLMIAGAGTMVLLAACYPLAIVTVITAQEQWGKPMTMLASINRGLVKEDYALRISEYRPEEGGTNCDSDCTKMASGDLVASWVGGRNGRYAAACPREWGWRTGDLFVVDGVEFECRDTGGWINCYEPGEMDIAIVNAHSKGHLRDVPAVAEESYCWVDLLGSWGVPYGTLATDWARVRQVSIAGSDNPFLPYRGINATALGGMHGGSPWEGRDYPNPKGTPLYAPEICPCTVVRQGFDGFVGPFGSNNSYLHLRTLDGVYNIVYLHGRYEARVGSTLHPGQRIGSEDGIGNSTGPHTHVSVRKNGIIIDTEDY